MGTKSEPGPHDCYANALPDEPMFVLLARDPEAPLLVERWAHLRLAEVIKGRRPPSDQILVEEAYQCADKMRDWYKSNKNETPWRKR